MRPDGEPLALPIVVLTRLEVQRSLLWLKQFKEALGLWIVSYPLETCRIMDGRTGWLKGAPCGGGQPGRNGSQQQEVQHWWPRWPIRSELELKIWKSSAQKAALNLWEWASSLQREKEKGQRRPQRTLYSGWINKLKGDLSSYLTWS